MPRLLTALAAAAALALPTLATAQDVNPNVLARQSLMRLNIYTLSLLGGMARGNVPYDPEVASAAAANLYHLARSGSPRMWAEGTDSATIQGTRALPAIWSDMAGFAGGFAALQAATETMMTAAGTDLASLQGAMGAIGAACNGCHQTYRTPD